MPGRRTFVTVDLKIFWGPPHLRRSPRGSCAPFSKFLDPPLLGQVTWFLFGDLWSETRNLILNLVTLWPHKGTWFLFGRCALGQSTKFVFGECALKMTVWHLTRRLILVWGLCNLGQDTWIMFGVCINLEKALDSCLVKVWPWTRQLTLASSELCGLSDCVVLDNALDTQFKCYCVIMYKALVS